MTSELPVCPLDGMNLDEMSVEMAVRQLFDYARAAGERHLPHCPREQRRRIGPPPRHVQGVAAIVVSAGRHFINHVKASAGMDVAQRRPADGRWLYRWKTARNSTSA